jgi:hypothetical protein
MQTPGSLRAGTPSNEEGKMMTKDRDMNTLALDQTEKASLRKVDVRAIMRMWAGSRGSRQVEGGLPTRLPSGEWMFRTSFDLPETMLDVLKERAGGDYARMGELIRAALVAAGVGGRDQIQGICDGTYSDDESERRIKAFQMRFQR